MKSILKKIIVLILTLEAICVLKRYKPKIVAISGSVGKTSTKDAVFTALSPFFKCRKTPKSFNSDIGVPLTILDLPNGWNDALVWIKNIFLGLKPIFINIEYPEYLILEIGADRPGDIASLMKYIKPDISVVTRMGKVPVHIEFFQSVSELIEEDSLIVKNLKKDGFLILNADDEDVLQMKKMSTAHLVTFGIKNEADIKGNSVEPLIEEDKVLGMTMKVKVSENNFSIKILGGFGVQHLYPVLASLAVVSVLQKSLSGAVKAFEEHQTPPGRMKILEGVSNSQIIDDTYNASPTAMKEGLDQLQTLKIGGRKIVVLGDMKELGKYTKAEHQKIGVLYKEHWFDFLFVVGEFAKDIAESAIGAGYPKDKVFYFNNSEDLAKVLPTFIKNKDILYFKASQSIRLEKALYSVLKDKEKAKTLLVRQEEEWQNR